MPDDQRTFMGKRVSWGAILAGVAAALVVQLLLNILGIGASSLDAANTGDNLSASGFSLAAGDLVNAVRHLCVARRTSKTSD